jgi:hypothetical protein
MSAPFFTLQCSRIIVNNVCKTRYHFLDFLHLQVPMVFAVIIFPLNSLLNLGISESLMFMFIIAFGMFNSFWFTTNAVFQITEYLDIWCLVIKHKSKDL